MSDYTSGEKRHASKLPVNSSAEGTPYPLTGFSQAASHIVISATTDASDFRIPVRDAQAGSGTCETARIVQERGDEGPGVGWGALPTGTYDGGTVTYGDRAAVVRR